MTTVIATRADNKRFRARIKRDAYDAQSWAVAEAWTPNGWTEVVTPLDFSTLRIAAHTYVERGSDWHFSAEQDARALLRLAMEVVP